MNSQIECEELEKAILDIIRKFNENGKVPTWSQIRDEMLNMLGIKPGESGEKERLGVCIAKHLKKLVNEGTIVMAKDNPKRRSSKALYALLEYEHLLPRISEEHILYIAEGFKDLYRFWNGMYEKPPGRLIHSSPSWYAEKGSTVFEALERAYHALQHILRGSAYRRLRESLNEIKYDDPIPTLEVRSKIKEFTYEAMMEGIKLSQLRNQIVKDSLKIARIYGTCEICGPKLDTKERNIIIEWWRKLNLDRYADLGPSF